MARLTRTFDRLRETRERGLVTFTTAGDPDLATSAAILESLALAGADVLEVGVPFSDPMADGPVIQRATERALAGGATLAGVLDMVADLRRRIDTPIVLFSYANPLYRMGFERFASRAASAGVDGVLALDVPLEESASLRSWVRAAGLDMIYLLSPTTTRERMRQAGDLGSGFVYAISRLGVTGVRQSLAAGVRDLVGRVREATDLPIAVGFGVSSAEHVEGICQWADAAVVGSALVSVIEQHGAAPDLTDRVAAYVRALKGDKA
jgi:tryptophan synthase alpha chain